MAHACSGAGHQYGGGGQYKGHHGRPTRVSLISQMSQMSDVQLQQVVNESLQQVNEEEETKPTKIVNNTSWLRQFSWNHKDRDEDGVNFELSAIEEAVKEKRLTCVCHCRKNARF